MCSSTENPITLAQAQPTQTRTDVQSREERDGICAMHTGDCTHDPTVAGDIHIGRKHGGCGLRTHVARCDTTSTKTLNISLYCRISFFGDNCITATRRLRRHNVRARPLSPTQPGFRVLARATTLRSSR